VGKMPSAPDPLVTAQAQTGMNRDTALTQQAINMVNTSNPWGSTNYAQTGTNTFIGADGKPVSTPQFTQTTTLSKPQQQIFNQTQQAQGNLAGIAKDQSAFLKDYLNKPFKFNNKAAEKWAYDLASPRILQQQGQNEATARATLANKGITEGSAPWIAEMTRLTNSNTDQMNQLALTGRGQAFSEALAQRNQPLNEITALLSGTQVSNPAAMGAATPQASVGNVDYGGLVQNKYNADVNRVNQGNSALGGLFGTAMSISDKRLKSEIQRVGTLDNGLGVYSYRLMGGPMQIGVMAQEVQKSNPDAVVMGADGLLRVNYEKAVS
jgi:hypothetical protein